MAIRFPEGFWDSVFDANSLITQVHDFRVITEAAADGHAEAVQWICKEFHGLAKLLAEIESALTRNN